MAVYTTTVPVARWDDPSHFTPTPPTEPTIGDRIIIPTSDWSLVITAGAMREIGTSEIMPHTNWAIDFQAPGGELIWEEDAQLTYRGPIRFRGGAGSRNSRLIFAPGFELRHDSTLANPQNQNYPVQMGDDVADYQCYCDFSACTNPAKWGLIQSMSPGGRGWFQVIDPSKTRHGGCAAPAGSGYVTHLRWGGQAVDVYAYTVTYGGQSILQWRNMQFIDCGGIYLPSVIPSATPALENVSFDNTQTNETLNMQGTGDADNPFVIDTSAFDRRVIMNNARDVQITASVFGERWPQLTGGKIAQLENSVLINNQDSQAFSTWGGRIKDCVLIHDQDLGNPHFIQSIPGIAVNEIDGLVTIYTGTAKQDAGDAIIMTAGLHHVDAKRVLVLATKDHSATTTLLSLLGSGGATVNIEKSTCIGHGIHTGETQVGDVDQIKYVIDCLFANFGGQTRYKIRDLQGVTLNPIHPANAHHNAGFGLAGGSNGKSYENLNLDPDDGTIGANDVDANPAFKRQFYLEDWDSDNGGPGTTANAIAQMLLFNGLSGDARYAPANLVAAFFGDNDNWAPTANEYVNTDSTGAGTIGLKNHKVQDVPTPPGEFQGYAPFGAGVFE